MSLLAASDGSKPVHTFCGMSAPDPAGKKAHADIHLQKQREHFVALGWAADSSRLLVASTSGALYLLGRWACMLRGDSLPAVQQWLTCLLLHVRLCSAGNLLRLWLPDSEAQLPWIKQGRRIVACELPATDTALVATSDALVFAVPLTLPQVQLAALKPVKLQSCHTELRALALNHQLGMVVAAGPGAMGGACPGTTLSVWAWKDRQLVKRSAHGKPQAAAGRDSDSLLPWVITFSPTAEYAAVAPAPGRCGAALLVVQGAEPA